MFKSFPSSAKNCRPVRAENVSGTAPVSVLRPARNVLRSVSSPSSVGINPVKKFPVIRRLIKPVSDPSSDGISAINSLSARLSDVKDVSVANSVGIVPWKSFSATFRTRSSGRLYTVGKFPTISFNCKSKTSVSGGTEGA